MLRYKLPIFLLLLIVSGCGLVDSNSNLKMNNPSFTITDTTGHSKTTFSPDEHFDLSFAYINTTPFTLTYTRGSSAPPVIFEILKDDSVIASSVDGYSFAQVVLGGHMTPKDTLKGQWQAPNTLYQNPKAILTPGLYQARVLFPSFGQTTASSHLDIAFSIIQKE